MKSEAVRRLIPTLARVLALASGLLFAMAGPAAAGALVARVEQPPVTQGDTFDLVLSLVGRDSLEPPNVAALSKDFDILDRSKRSGSAMAAGRPVEVAEWLLTLAPKRAGRLTIPAFTVAGETSSPITLDVAPGTSSGPPDDGPFSIDLSLGGNPPYFMHSDVPMRLRIFDRVGATRVSDEQGAIADGARFTPDGAPRTYWRTFGNQRYLVREIRFMVQPQRPGTISMSPLVLTATIPDPASPGGRRIEVRSNGAEAVVRPRPEGVDGWFLPARAVTLTQAWSGSPAAAKVGVALTRTVRIEARGAGANQLPPLSPPEADGVRQYAGEAMPQRALVDGAPGAILETAITIVPTRAGTLTLPAISVPWWNMATEQQDVAILPAVTLTVAPAGRPAPAPADARPVAAGAPARNDVSEVSGAMRQVLSALQEHGWMAGMALAILAVGAALIALRPRNGPAGAMGGLGPQLAVPGGAGVARPKRRGTGAAGAARRPSNAKEKRAAAAGKAGPARARDARGEAAAVRALDAACRGGDPRAAHRAYLAWSRTTGAGAPAAPDMVRAVADLGRHLYAGGAKDWDSRAFRKAFAAEQRARKRGKAASAAPRLAPLYPGAR
ncbi:BatD family protein [Xanthobacter sp. AM11]|uniref:BatD family protein n=1 Tax=Xanthobacter sp. AM11 TaxID=3380643 RepID=UPI0039BF0F6C